MTAEFAIVPSKLCARAVNINLHSSDISYSARFRTYCFLLLQSLEYKR